MGGSAGISVLVFSSPAFWQANHARPSLAFTSRARFLWDGTDLERWNRSVKEECLSKLILFGEPAIRHALTHYVQHYHEERNHQGKDNLILVPAAADRIGRAAGKIQTRERLGGLLKFYHREAA